MIEILHNMKSLARDLARDLPTPSFYTRFATEMAFSWDLFFNSPVVLKLQEDALAFLYDDFMFGIEHSKKVAQDASTILLAEDSGLSKETKLRLAPLAQVAGLLHDIECVGDDHAERGADTVASLLEPYALPGEDKEMIATAIACHESLTDVEYPGKEVAAISRALYDADKFRFGADIFATTLWIYCDYNNADLAAIARRFPRGLERAQAVAGTFRTKVGAEHGDEILAQGMTVGETMLEKLNLAAGLKA